MDHHCQYHHRKKKGGGGGGGGYLLIDLSSLIFHILFACINLYDKRCGGETSDKCDKNIYVLKCFKKLFLRKIRSLIDLHQTSKLVFARDVKKIDIWRTQIFDKYKSHRSITIKHKGSDLNIGIYFDSIYRHFYDKIVAELGVITVKVPHAEADDIIMVLTQYLNSHGERVVIISDDYDYYPLLQYHGVEVYNTHGADFSDKITGIAPQEYLVMKILSGDKSDNIPACKILRDQFGILKKRHIRLEDAQIYIKLGIFKIDTIDKHLAMKMRKNPDQITQLLALDPIFQHSFNRNSTLIDMNKIPKEIQENIITKFIETKPGESIIP